MKLIKFLSFLLVFIFILFLISINGFSTSSLNTTVKGKIEERLAGSVINFSNIKISLDPSTFAINAKLNDPEFSFKNKKIEVKNVSTQLDLVSIFQDEKRFKSSFLELGKTDILTLLPLLRDFNPNVYQKDVIKLVDTFFETIVGDAFSFNRLSLILSSSTFDGTTLHSILLSLKIFFLTSLFEASIISLTIIFIYFVYFNY